MVVTLRLALALVLAYLNGWGLFLLLLRDGEAAHPAERYAFSYGLGLIVVGAVTWICTLFHVQGFIPILAVASVLVILFLARREIGHRFRALGLARLKRGLRPQSLFVLLALGVIFTQFLFAAFYVTRMPSWQGDVLRGSAYTGRMIASSSQFTFLEEPRWGVRSHGFLMSDLTSIYLYRFLGELNPLAIRIVEACHFLCFVALCGGVLARKRSGMHGAVLAAFLSLTPIYVHQVIIGYRDLVFTAYICMTVIAFQRFTRSARAGNALLTGLLFMGMILFKRSGIVYTIPLSGFGILYALPKLSKVAPVRAAGRICLILVPILLAGTWVLFVEETPGKVAGAKVWTSDQLFQDPLFFKVGALANIVFHEFLLSGSEEISSLAAQWYLFWPFVFLCILLHPIRALREEHFLIGVIVLLILATLAPLRFGVSLLTWAPSIERYLLPVSGLAFLVAGSLAPDLGNWGKQRKRKETEEQAKPSVAPA